MLRAREAAGIGNEKKFEGDTHETQIRGILAWHFLPMGDPFPVPTLAPEGPKLVYYLKKDQAYPHNSFPLPSAEVRILKNGILLKMD